MQTLHCRTVRYKGWYIKVSVNKTDDIVCVIMYHILDFITHVKYFNNENEASMFIDLQIQLMDEQ